MPTLTARSVHVDRIMSQFSLAQIQSSDGFLATKVFPMLPVAKQSDKYYVYPREAFLRDDFERRAPATESAGSGFDLSQDSYYCNVWALHNDIPDEVRSNADDGIEVEEDARRFLTSQALQRLEREWMATFFTSGVWTTNLTATGGGTAGTTTPRQWSDYANSDPFLDMQLLRGSFRLGSGGLRPNIAVMGFAVYQALIDHPKLIDRVKYTSGDGLGEAAIAKALGLDAIYVADAVGLTSAEGITPSTSAFLGGKHVLFAYRPAGSQTGRLSAAAGKTFMWTGLNGGSLPTPVNKYRMDLLKADRIECEMAFDMKVTAPDLGYFIQNAVA